MGKQETIGAFEIFRSGTNDPITTVRDPHAHIWALNELRDLTAKKFYGKVILIMEDGKITRGEIRKSIKP